MSAEAIIQNHQFGHRSDLLVCLQRECSCLLDTLELLYADRPSLNRPEVSELYASLRYGGVSSRQLNAAIRKVCSRPEDMEKAGIRKDELAVLLPELDRRYFIVQGAQWEFQFLDRHWNGEISEKDALFLFKAVHGNRFVMYSWETFLSGRAERGSKVTWEEIEVPLCDNLDDRELNLLKEKESKAKEERQIREKELAQKRKERMVKEREKQLREQRAREQQLREEQLAKEREEQLAKEREEQLAKEREEQLAREREEQVAKEREEELARKREEELAREVEKMSGISHEATGERDKLTTAAVTPNELTSDHEASSVDSSVSKETEHSNDDGGREERRVEEEKHKQLRAQLEQAVQSKDVAELEPAVEAVKKKQVPNCSELLEKAEKLLKKLYATKNLHDATVARKLAALEKAIDAVKKGGWEKDLQREMQEANTLLEKLRRLEQRKKAVLELSQQVIAELKSYSNPPPQVHQMMRATFLLLGNSEQETKSWQATQVLIGKTGKGSLKRRVAECSAKNVPLSIAERASIMVQQFDAINIQDTSLGCATFHAWAEGIIEEVQEMQKL